MYGWSSRKARDVRHRAPHVSQGGYGDPVPCQDRTMAAEGPLPRAIMAEMICPKPCGSSWRSG